MRRRFTGMLGGVALLALAGTALGCAGTLAGAFGARSGASWDELMRVGDRFRQSGDLERAQVAYLRAWQAEPERPLAQIRLAQLQLRRDPAQAAASFRSVLARAPDETRAWTGLGMAALALGRLGEAEEAFGEASRRAEDSALAQGGHAVALDLLGRTDEAREALARARALRPEDAWLLNNLGVSRLLAQDWSGAEAALRTAIELDPADPALRNNLGLALGRQQRYDEALEVFAAAGDERAARNNLGYVYFLNGRYSEAVAEYERALAVDGGDPRAVLANLNSALDALEAETKGGVERHASR